MGTRKIKRKIKAVFSKRAYKLQKIIDTIAYPHIKNADTKARNKTMACTEIERNALLELLRTPTLPNDGIIISMVGASRKINNPNNRLEKLVQSVLQKTKDISRLEIVLRIDEDDNLDFYRYIRQKYGNEINIRFVIGAAKGGYLGLHRLVAETLDKLSPNSLIAFGVADDCRMLRKNWDDEFIKIIEQYPDNIYFINTRHNFKLSYENERTFFWMLWLCGPPSPFAAVGLSVLRITAEIAKKYNDWTAYGNSVMCDSFFETLNYYLYNNTGQNREPIIADILVARLDTIIPPHKQGGGPFVQSQLVINCYTEFIKESTQSVIREMAGAISSKIEPGKKNDIIPKDRNAMPEIELEAVA